jgi:uncharacterized membrane protein
MPLSEHEQKILTDLEESLRQHDPHFAKSVGNLSLYARQRRRRLLSVIGFIVGLAVLVAFFTQSIPLGLVGLAMMVASALAFASNAFVDSASKRE